MIQQVMLANRVIDSGCPNRWGCRIPVKSTWNLDYLRHELKDDQDIDNIEWLKFGFPISYDDKAEMPTPADRNHLGATMFPQHIEAYLRKEMDLGATIGPFSIPPFITRIGVSPMSTRPKKQSDQRRVILDLSFPIGSSVNSAIDKNFYCGTEITLTYPTVDTLAKRIADLAEQNKHSSAPQKILLWKLDLERYFRQLPLCPRDYSLIGTRWNGFLFFDTMVPMGLCSASYIAQKTSSMLVNIHRNYSYWAINYLDDFGSAEFEQKAWNSFLALKQILVNAGVKEASDKAVPPTTCLEFLGNLLNTDEMTIGVTPERKQELIAELQAWKNKETATKKQLQSLIGKLNFVTNCIKAGRIFLSRLIQALAHFPEVGRATVPKQILKDVEWWLQYLPDFDGTAILWLQDCMEIDHFMETDACLTAGGAHCDREYIHFRFSQEIMDQTHHISQRELLTIVIALKIWCKKLSGKVVRISSDNEPSVFAVNKGKTNDVFMLRCIREIAWICSKNQILLRLKFLPGNLNKISDALSRWYINGQARRWFKSTTNNKWKRRSVTDEMMLLNCNW